LNRLKQIEDKLNDIEAKIANLSIRIDKLEGKSPNLDLEKLKKELEELKNAHSQTVIKVNNNKEQIDLILARLKDIIKGYKEGDENLQKEMDELKKKLQQINTQLDLLLKLPRGEGKSDLSALNDLLKKIMDLERDYKEFVEKVNIDEIYRQLKFLHETKADKKDVNKKIDDLNEKYDNHQLEIDAINRRLDSLFNQLANMRQDGGECLPSVLIFLNMFQKSILKNIKRKMMKNSKKFGKKSKI
jgi:chromosome segregation ATPase